LTSLKYQINKTKITLRELECYINRDLFYKLIDLLVKYSIIHFQECTHKFLKGELIVKTAKNIDIDEDMERVYDESTGENYRVYVRKVYITAQYSHIVLKTKIMMKNIIQ
jgi:hypothetical protein